MTQAPVHHGRCLCGDVSFTVTGPAKWVAYCHCHSCRKQTGAPVSAYAGFEREQVAFAGAPLAQFVSSPGVSRGFCGRCGSTLTFRGERWPTETHIHLGAFDAPADFPPTGHAFPEERVPWLHLESPPLED